MHGQTFPSQASRSASISWELAASRILLTYLLLERAPCSSVPRHVGTVTTALCPVTYGPALCPVHDVQIKLARISRVKSSPLVGRASGLRRLQVSSNCVTPGRSVQLSVKRDCSSAKRRAAVYNVNLSVCLSVRRTRQWCRSFTGSSLPGCRSAPFVWYAVQTTSEIVTHWPSRCPPVAIGDRAFAVAGARLWNSLPHDIIAHAVTVPMRAQNISI